MSLLLSFYVRYAVARSYILETGVSVFHVMKQWVFR